MDNRHPVTALLAGKERGMGFRVDSLSMHHAKIDPEEMIKDDLVKSILKDFMKSEDSKGVITKVSEHETDTIYHARLFVLSPDDMFKLLSDAFQMGADFQYNAMSRVLGEQIAKAEESKNDTTKTDSE